MGEVRRLRDEANRLRSRLDQITMDYAAGELSARQLEVATEVTVSELADMESRLARIGSSNALMRLMSASTPTAAWTALDDVDAQAAVMKALGEVLVHRPPRGRRPPRRTGRSASNRWKASPLRSIFVGMSSRSSRSFEVPALGCVRQRGGGP
ncbi:hypothetical protein GCM10017557_70380 [Streptomyces aurantiacus]|uniref:Uncharacterized protein n=1 Tax=Streptomyces aurantiacus TaxID=47760 RepID=A0A7G1P9Z4_9ACTN|nr:hypothetical protein GCM10017557_70380 [Streptomyces aurantiacus]